MMMRMTPKVNVNPEAISAYTLTVRMPSTTASRTRVIRPDQERGRRSSPSPYHALLPGLLRVFGLGSRHGCGVDKGGLAPLPLLDVDADSTLRPSRRVERHWSLDGLVRALMQCRDQLGVVDAVGLGGCLVDDLSDAVGLGRVGADVAGRTAVLRDELGDELGIAIGRGAASPSRRDHDALGVGAQLVGY